MPAKPAGAPVTLLTTRSDDVRRLIVFLTETVAGAEPEMVAGLPVTIGVE